MMKHTKGVKGLHHRRCLGLSKGSLVESMVGETIHGDINSLDM